MTVHPFCVHWWDADNRKLRYKTYCVISNEITHDANTFHVFRMAVMKVMKDDPMLPLIERIYYISDGAGSQYKNFKNFANLMFHKQDFDVDAEWIFTATAHVLHRACAME